jgi:hypothetical protein
MAGKFYQVKVILASAARASTGNSNTTGSGAGCVVADGVDKYDDIAFYVSATADSSGTTFDAFIEGFDGTVWVPCGTMTQIGSTTPALQVVKPTMAAVAYRFAWTIVGTSYTFAVNAVVGSVGHIG